MPQIRLADIVGKTIHYFFVPADQKAVTFVLVEGRMSLGAPSVRIELAPLEPELAKITSANVNRSEDGGVLTLRTDKGVIAIAFQGASELTELPE